MLWFHAFFKLGVIIHPYLLCRREAAHATPKARYHRRCRCHLSGRAAKYKRLGKTAFGWYSLAWQLSVSAAHIVARCLVAVSGAVIHAPPNALPLSALLFLVLSLVISSLPICAFLPPHPYCLTPLSILSYTPIAHSPSVPFLPFQCCFVPFRPFPRFLSSFFHVPSPSSWSFQSLWQPVSPSCSCCQFSVRDAVG